MVGASGETPLDRREAGALAGLLVAGALILGRQLGAPSVEFDEGVYLSSLELLSRGLELGEDVFTSQPPLFLGLLDLANSVADGSAAALRAVTVGVALAGALAGWAIVRGISGPFAGLAAAGLVVLAPGVVDAAAIVSADVPSVALGTLSLLAARAARRRPLWGAMAGALVVTALAVKLLAAPFAVALLAGALAERPPRRAVAWFAAGALTVLAMLALTYASVLGELWRGAVALHLEARGAPVELPRPSIAVEASLIAAAYAGLLWLLAAGLRARHAGALEWIRARADLLALLGAGLLLVAIHRPLLHHHLVVVAWPLALLAASTLPSRPSRRALAAVGACALLVLPWAARGRDTLGDSAGAAGHEIAEPSAARVAEVLRRHTPVDAVVVSDLPLAPLLADRAPASATVDPSYVRVSTGSLGRAAILRASGHADAVVVGRSFDLLPRLHRALGRRFGRVVRVDGARVYLRARRAVRPGGRRARPCAPCPRARAPRARGRDSSA